MNGLSAEFYVILCSAGVVALIIVKKFGRIIANVLTILGGLLALACIYVLYQVISGGIDLHTVETILEVFK